MEINTISYATRAMTIAFKCSIHGLKKSKKRRIELKATAKKLIDATEDYIKKQDKEKKQWIP